MWLLFISYVFCGLWQQWNVVGQHVTSTDHHRNDDANIENKISSNHLLFNFWNQNMLYNMDSMKNDQISNDVVIRYDRHLLRQVDKYDENKFKRQTSFSTFVSENSNNVWRVIQRIISYVRIRFPSKKIAISFMLMDTNTHMSIDGTMPIQNNDIINLIKVGTDITIQAIVTYQKNGSIVPQSLISNVTFILDDITIHSEAVVPYLLAGDWNGDYYSATMITNPNDYGIKRNLTVVVHSAATTTTEMVLATETIFFTVVNGTAPTAPSPLIPAPSPPKKPIPPPVPIMQPNPSPVVTSSTDVQAYNHHPDGAITGELRMWHKITIGFDGPMTSESSSPNPFTYYCLDVTFIHVATKNQMTVPGYYAADGNAANTGATSGNVWLVHFIPNAVGQWSWKVSFSMGTNVAQNGNGISAGYFDQKNGTFSVNVTNKNNPDLRSKGLLQYVNEHHLRFAGNGQYFIKAGADAPENFLAYEDFDNTPNYMNYRKTWQPHIQDYVPMDGTTWQNGKGKGIIGAINYLSNKGMNTISMLTMNINGDDRNVFPYVTTNDFQRIDVSKTAQWEIVLEHADHMGMFLHYKTQETENDQLLDNGDLGLNRKLYYRELIARFGHHLALNWNLGEENTNTIAQLKSYCDYFTANDPYHHLIVVHTFPGAQDSVYTPLLGYRNFTGVSLQIDRYAVPHETDKWIQASDNADHKWVVSSDEIGSASDGVVPDTNDYNHDSVRKYVLWGNYMNNGGGVEYYFGYKYPNSDLTCEDYRSRDHMWTLSNIALNFFHNFSIPFWNMTNSVNQLLSTNSQNYCMATNNLTNIIMYLPNGGSDTVDLTSVSSTKSYNVRWYDPINGGMLQIGTVSTLSGGRIRSIGFAPKETTRDWAIVMKGI